MRKQITDNPQRSLYDRPSRSPISLDKDTHLWPGNGSIDWKETMNLLRTAPQTPPLLLEIEGEEKKNSSDEVSATFRKLEDA